MSKRLTLAILATLAVATACSSGGGNVTSPNSLNPTFAPTGATASPTSSSGATATASPTAGSGTTATPIATPTATPTVVASASPSSVAVTPSPTPVASASAIVATPSPTPMASASAGNNGLATTCATASAATSSMMYTLPGTAETINLPNYPASPPYQITGTSMIPSQSPANTVLTLQFNQNKIDNTSQTPSGKTTDFYATLEENSSTTFGNGSTSLLIPVTIVSPCVVQGTTYETDEVSGGLSVYTETDMATQAGSVTGHIKAALNPFPANTLVDITVSH